MGGVRTALYNYLYAKQAGGDFIIRIEDTDSQRFVPGAEKYIIDALNWCGIIPDEGVDAEGNVVETPSERHPHAPYRQSQRKPIYRAYAEQLIGNGYAYYAFDSQVTRVGQERAGELVNTLVGGRIGEVGALQAGELHGAAGDGVTVFAVVKKRCTVAILGYVHPLVSADLELCTIPAGVAVSGSCGVSELYLAGRLSGVDVYRKGELKEIVLLVPIDDVLEIYSRRAAV